MSTRRPLLVLLSAVSMCGCAPTLPTRPPSEVCDDPAACLLVGTELRPAARRRIAEDFARRQQKNELLLVYYDYSSMALVPACHIAGSYVREADQDEVTTWTRENATFLRSKGSGFRTDPQPARVRVRPFGRSSTIEEPINPGTKRCRFATHYAREVVIGGDAGEQYPIALRLEPLPVAPRPTAQPDPLRTGIVPLDPNQVHIPRTHQEPARHPDGRLYLGEDLEILRAAGIGALQLMCAIAGGDCGDEDEDEDE